MTTDEIYDLQIKKERKCIGFLYAFVFIPDTANFSSETREAKETQSFTEKFKAAQTWIPKT